MAVSRFTFTSEHWWTFSVPKPVAWQICHGLSGQRSMSCSCADMELKKAWEREISQIQRCCWRLEFPSVLPSGQQNRERLTLLLWDSGSLWSWIVLVLMKKKEDSMSFWGFRELYNMTKRFPSELCEQNVRIIPFMLLTAMKESYSID